MESNKTSSHLKVLATVLGGLLLVTITFFGGYLLGVDVERKVAESRISDLSASATECEKNLAMWCSNSRVRAGTCDGKINMCMCVNESEMKGFEL